MSQTYLTFEQFKTLALTNQGLLSDLMAHRDDPNTVLNKNGLGQLTPEDVTQWLQALENVSILNTEEILNYIGRLTDHHEGSAPPMW